MYRQFTNLSLRFLGFCNSSALHNNIILRVEIYKSSSSNALCWIPIQGLFPISNDEIFGDVIFKSSHRSDMLHESTEFLVAVC